MSSLERDVNDTRPMELCSSNPPETQPETPHDPNGVPGQDGLVATTAGVLNTAPVLAWLKTQAELAEANERVEELKARAKVQEQAVMDEMLSSGMPLLPVEIDGERYSVFRVTTLWAGRVAGVEVEDLCSALEETEWAHLVKKNINTQTLSSVVREQLAAKQPLPGRLGEVIKTSEVVRLGFQKSSARKSTSARAAEFARSQKEGNQPS